MKKTILALPLILALQGCSSIMPAEDLDLNSTKERTAATVTGAAVGAYLGAKLGGDSAAGRNLGLLAGTYVGMLSPAALYQRFGGQMVTETRVRKRYQ